MSAEQTHEERIEELQAELEAQTHRANLAERRAESLIIDRARHDRRDEVARLRAYIRQRAGELQVPEYGHLGSGCHCRGCELLIGMDDVPEEQIIEEE